MFHMYEKNIQIQQVHVTDKRMCNFIRAGSPSGPSKIMCQGGMASRLGFLVSSLIDLGLEVKSAQIKKSR